MDKVGLIMGIIVVFLVAVATFTHMAIRKDKKKKKRQEFLDYFARKDAEQVVKQPEPQSQPEPGVFVPREDLYNDILPEDSIVIEDLKGKEVVSENDIVRAVSDVIEATPQDKGVVVTIMDPSEVSQEEKNAAADLVFESFENSLKLMRPKEERTGRYSLGQKLIGVSFKYVSELGEMMQANVLPLKYNSDIPTEVHFVEFTVQAHFKVSDRNDPQDRKDCDGYLLRDDKGVVWKNQYPHATYGQLDDSADRFFTTDEYFKSPFTFTSAHLLSDRVSSICRGIDQLKKQAEKSPNEDAKQVCLAKVSQLEQLQNLIKTEFKKKFPNKEFSYFPIWADGNTAKEVVITDC